MHAEQQAIDLKHNRSHTEPKYIAFLHLNLAFLPEETGTIERMYKQGVSVVDIAEALKRPQEEICCLIMDRAMLGKLEPRKSGIWKG